MRAISVFYDARCGLCDGVRRRFAREPVFVPLHFVPYDSALARTLFPGITDWQPDREILALTDEGDLYRGDGAWILCLWATVRYREWSLRLANPALRPLTGSICGLISRHRGRLSELLRLGTDRAVRTFVETTAYPTAMGRACQAARGAPAR
jgi:predicted DCC family thiol-disulfide oxidoreductase YuxK